MTHAEKSDWLIAKFIHSLINHLLGRDRGRPRVSKEETRVGSLGGLGILGIASVTWWLQLLPEEEDVGGGE